MLGLSFHPYILHPDIAPFSLHVATSDCDEPILLDSRPGNNAEWTQVSCGGDYTSALTKKGELYTWGSHRSGQLGNEETRERGHDEDSVLSRTFPTKVDSLYETVIIKVVCGEYHMAAIKWHGHNKITRSTDLFF